MRLTTRARWRALGPAPPPARLCELMLSAHQKKQIAPFFRLPTKRGEFEHIVSMRIKPFHAPPLHSCVTWVRTPRSCQRQQAIAAWEIGEPHVLDGGGLALQ